MSDFLLWAFFALIVIINGAWLLLSKSFVKGWVEGDIGEYFKLREENREHDRQIRLKAALIAELFAEWTTQSKDMKKLRQLTFDAFLWLPEPLANELSKILSHDDGAIGIRDYVIQVRKYLLGDDDGLTTDKIITFRLTNSEANANKR